jgi:hypothetical protein
MAYKDRNLLSRAWCFFTGSKLPLRSGGVSSSKAPVPVLWPFNFLVKII